MTPTAGQQDDGTMRVTTIYGTASHGGTMTPLGRYSLYCSHGVHVGHECVRCWQRRALDAEAALVALQTTIAELREELAQAHNALANSH